MTRIARWHGDEAVSRDKFVIVFIDDCLDLLLETRKGMNPYTRSLRYNGEFTNYEGRLEVWESALGGVPSVECMREIEHRNDGALNYLDRIWVPLKGDIGLKVKAEHHRLSVLRKQPEIPEWKWERIAMDFAMKLSRTGSGHDTIWVIMDRLTKSAHFLPMRKDYKMDRIARLYLNEIIARHDVPISSYRIVIADVGEGQVIGPELVQETTKKFSQIKDRHKAMRDHQKSYADKRRKPLV
ncbi:reverse transcriptase domain-containing protein [Tanacetum coccineum]